MQTTTSYSRVKNLNMPASHGSSDPSRREDLALRKIGSELVPAADEDADPEEAVTRFIYPGPGGRSDQKARSLADVYLTRKDLHQAEAEHEGCSTALLPGHGDMQQGAPESVQAHVRLSRLLYEDQIHEIFQEMQGRWQRLGLDGHSDGATVSADGVSPSAWTLADDVKPSVLGKLIERYAVRTGVPDRQSLKQALGSEPAQFCEMYQAAIEREYVFATDKGWPKAASDETRPPQDRLPVHPDRMADLRAMGLCVEIATHFELSANIIFGVALDLAEQGVTAQAVRDHLSVDVKGREPPSLKNLLHAFTAGTRAPAPVSGAYAAFETECTRAGIGGLGGGEGAGATTASVLGTHPGQFRFRLERMLLSAAQRLSAGQPDSKSGAPITEQAQIDQMRQSLASNPAYVELATLEKLASMLCEHRGLPETSLGGALDERWIHAVAQRCERDGASLQELALDNEYTADLFEAPQEILVAAHELLGNSPADYQRMCMDCLERDINQRNPDREMASPAQAAAARHEAETHPVYQMMLLFAHVAQRSESLTARLSPEQRLAVVDSMVYNLLSPDIGISSGREFEALCTRDLDQQIFEQVLDEVLRSTAPTALLHISHTKGTMDVVKSLPLLLGVFALHEHKSSEKTKPKSLLIQATLSTAAQLLTWPARRSPYYLVCRVAAKATSEFMTRRYLGSRQINRCPDFLTAAPMAPSQINKVKTLKGSRMQQLLQGAPLRLWASSLQRPGIASSPSILSGIVRCFMTLFEISRGDKGIWGIVLGEVMTTPTSGSSSEVFPRGGGSGSAACHPPAAPCLARPAGRRAHQATASARSSNTGAGSSRGPGAPRPAGGRRRRMTLMPLTLNAPTLTARERQALERCFGALASGLRPWLLPPVSGQAQPAGCLVLDECLVQLDHDVHTGQLRMRCQMNHLVPTQTLTRRMLELNLTQARAGIVFGLKPGTADVEVTLSVPMVFAEDREDDVGLHMLALLLQQVQAASGQPVELLSRLQPAMAAADDAQPDIDGVADPKDGLQIEAQLRLALRAAYDGMCAALSQRFTAVAGVAAPIHCIVHDGVVIALSFSEHHGMVGFHADMGVPLADDEFQTMRRLLEHSEHMSCAGPILHGLNPAAGRLVALVECHQLLLDEDGGTASRVIEELAHHAGRLRAQ